jgi:phosphonate C-P lyase system protein PhnG
MKRQTTNPAETLPACITQMSGRAVRKLLGLLTGEDIAFVRGPLTGLVTMLSLDSFEADFYLGDVLVTEAEMVYAGCHGYGMVIGDDGERAIARASVEAIGASTNRIPQVRVNRFLHTEAKKLEARRKKEASLIAGTRVDFETMKRT